MLVLPFVLEDVILVFVFKAFLINKFILRVLLSVLPLRDRKESYIHTTHFL